MGTIENAEGIVEREGKFASPSDTYLHEFVNQAVLEGTQLRPKHVVPVFGYQSKQRARICVILRTGPMRQ